MTSDTSPDSPVTLTSDGAVAAITLQRPSPRVAVKEQLLAETNPRFNGK